jgi:O-antigen ligase
MGRARAGQERKALSRLGSLFHYWFLHAKRLFHMLIALAFMLLTFAVAYQTFEEWEDYRKTPAAGLLYFELYGGFAVFLAILCLYSFVKARNVR